MDVAEASFNEIISQARTQFVIPIWQRLYSWETKEWNDLWEDLTNLYKKLRKEELAEHFLGSIVVKTVEEKVGEITKRVLIDGQQRLTTLLLICALIRNKARIEGNESLANEIEDSLLFNKYAKRAEDRPKLRPTEADRKLFDAIITGEDVEEHDTGSQLYAAYKFFAGVLANNKYDLEGLLNGIRKLKIVTIRLDERDNPNRIFETLNYRGKELSQSDLIRNYFMMAIKDLVKADQVYNDVWLPMQQNLGLDTLERMENLESFLRHYIIMIKQRVIREDKIYAEMRDRLKDSNEDEVISELKTIKKYSQYYERLLYPIREEDTYIRKGIQRLNRLKIGVHYPFLLKIYHMSNSGKLDKNDFCIILKTIESYFVRRFFSRLPTNSLNRLFASLCALPETNLINSLENELASKASWSAQYWPKDDEFKEKFKTIPIYDISPERCFLVLETLEESFRHPEEIMFENLTIEHIMPETLNDEWKSYLGANWKDVHNNYLHTIGNLTLIAGPPNSAIQNKLYPQKKEEWYKNSKVGLTIELSQLWNQWTENEIRERAEVLAERALRIWPRPT
jgi:uncharacterized protein with ParB-like and HNH nuclease domain